MGSDLQPRGSCPWDLPASYCGGPTRVQQSGCRPRAPCKNTGAVCAGRRSWPSSHVLWRQPPKCQPQEHKSLEHGRLDLPTCTLGKPQATLAASCLSFAGDETKPRDMRWKHGARRAAEKRPRRATTARRGRAPRRALHAAAAAAAVLGRRRTAAAPQRRRRWLHDCSSREQDAEMMDQAMQRNGCLGAEDCGMSGPWRAGAGPSAFSGVIV